MKLLFYHLKDLHNMLQMILLRYILFNARNELNFTDDN